MSNKTLWHKLVVCSILVCVVLIIVGSKLFFWHAYKGSMVCYAFAAFAYGVVVFANARLKKLEPRTDNIQKQSE